MQELPEQAGIQLANWYWKGVRQFVWERFGISLSRSSCLNWLHRLGFAFKRPKKRLLKADEAKRKSFVEEYAALWSEIAPHGRRRAKDMNPLPAQIDHHNAPIPSRGRRSAPPSRHSTQAPTDYGISPCLRRYPTPPSHPSPHFAQALPIFPPPRTEGGRSCSTAPLQLPELRATRCGFSATRSVCCATPNATPGDTSRPARNITCCLDDR